MARLYIAVRCSLSDFKAWLVWLAEVGILHTDFCSQIPMPAWLLAVAAGALLPTRQRKAQLVQKWTLAAVLVAALLLLTPEKALEGAPFHIYEPLEIAYFTCMLLVRTFDFCPLDLQSCVCQNPLALATVAHCYIETNPQQIELFLDKCEGLNVTVLRGDFERAHAEYLRNAQPAPKEGPILAPVALNTSFLMVMRDSYDQFLGNYNRSITLGTVLAAYWLVVFAVLGLANWTKIFLPGLHRMLTDPVSNWVRRNITLPAMGSRKTSEKPFWKVDMLVPSRLETVLLGIFTLMSAYFAVCHIHLVDNELLFSSKIMSFCRLYAVRSGILASYMFPYVILFAGRNNLLQLLTRWEYAAFVTLHRWVSRIMYGLLVVHLLLYAYYYFSDRGEQPIGFVLWGIAGLVSGLAIMIQGLLVLRRKWYEVFLILHIALALVFCVGAYLHVEDRYFLWFYYLSAWLWVCDRVVRIQTLLAFGFPVAKVQLYEDNTLKVVVPTPPGFEAIGGGHCFLHFLRWLCFWQLHPFTYTVLGHNIVFYVKVKDGVTSSLAAYLLTHPKRAAYIRVAVEGLYGDATPAANYDKSVFVAGGNGIPGIYAEALVAAKVRPVELIWVVRENILLLWFFEELMSLKGLPVTTTVYVSQPHSPIHRDKLRILYNTYTHYAATENDPVALMKRDLSHVTFKDGRPDIGGLVEDTVQATWGTVCFVTCGHPAMVDELRKEVVKNVGATKHRVDFFEQLQVWS